MAKATLETSVTTDGDSLDERVDKITSTAGDGKGIGAREFRQFFFAVIALMDVAFSLARKRSSSTLASPT